MMNQLLAHTSHHILLCDIYFLPFRPLFGFFRYIFSWIFKLKVNFIWLTIIYPTNLCSQNSSRDWEHSTYMAWFSFMWHLAQMKQHIYHKIYFFLILIIYSYWTLFGSLRKKVSNFRGCAMYRGIFQHYQIIVFLLLY